MPRKAPLNAALLQGAAAPPVLVRPSGDLLGQAGSRDALAQLDAAMVELRQAAVRPMLQRAMVAIQADDYRTGCKWAIKALQQDERNGFGWYLLAIARERAGDFASSVSCYQAALKLLPDQLEIANDLGRLAYRMGMTEQAEKLFRLFLTRHPNSPEAANNLACTIRDQDRSDEAMAILRPAIEKDPSVPMLWNTMGTLLAEQGDFPTADIFFQEALRLTPDFPKARHNHSTALLAQGDSHGALEASDMAIASVLAEDDREMMRLSRSTTLLTLGRIGEGWDEYDVRLSPQFNGVTHFAIDRPAWKPGADLAGKTLLVIGEQGLGDEVLFANTLPDIVERLGPEGQMILAVERRLVTLFQRAFPQAQVGAHATFNHAGRTYRTTPDVDDLEKVDLWAPIASLLREFRRSVEAFPVREPLLKPDPERVAHWRAALDEAPEGAKIGLLWKSAIQKQARHRFYSPFESWAPVLKQEGATFVNLQYGDCSEELAWVKRELGVDIWNPPGIDLKQDLDDLAALSCAMDLVVGFSNATLNIAAACGVPTFLISTPGAWTRLGTTEYPWYPQTRVFLPPAFREWEPVMAEVADAVGAYAAFVLDSRPEH
jgi:cytochrome c-type biogenesis protein CcmH/NrfG